MLRSIETQQVKKIENKRKRYELEVESKKTEMPSIIITSYNASVDGSLFKHLLFMGSFDRSHRMLP